MCRGLFPSATWGRTKPRGAWAPKWTISTQLRQGRYRWADSDTICNNLRKSASHIYAIPQKNQSQLKLLAVINKAHICPVNIRCGTHHTPIHITQSIKLGYHNNHSPSINDLTRSFTQTNSVHETTKDLRCSDKPTRLTPLTVQSKWEAPNLIPTFNMLPWCGKPTMPQQLADLWAEKEELQSLVLPKPILYL